MKNILFLVCAFALFSASFVSAAHAHVEKQSADQEIELSVDQDNRDSGNLSDPLRDMHCHNHMAQANFTQKTLPKATNNLLPVFSQNVISSPVYGLKCHPKGRLCDEVVVGCLRQSF